MGSHEGIRIVSNNVETPTAENGGYGLLAQALYETDAIARAELEEKKPIKLVFVAGPYTAGTLNGTLANVHAAMAAGLSLRRFGFVPLIPHLCHFLDEFNKQTGGVEVFYEGWMEITLEYVRRSDAVYVLADSPGTVREIALAVELGIPVFRSYSKLVSASGDVD